MSDFVSNGWSWFVILATAAGLVFCAVVLGMSARHRVIRDAQGQVDPTTGHVWDGDLQELNNPLPRWWLMLFIITLVFSVAYLVLYPGMGVFKGQLGWSSEGQYQDELARLSAAQQRIFARFTAVKVEDLARDTQAHDIGQRLFLHHCAMCHGSDARGAKGIPNLTDRDWLHGGSPDNITETLHDGRRGMMPPMAAAVGGPDEVRQVAHFVLSLSGSPHNALLAELGREKFKACAACHGADGHGNQALGAPNLTDRIWLHGWGEQAIVDMVNHGKVNVMPAQKDRLNEGQIRVLAAYVWGLSNEPQRVQSPQVTTQP